VCGGLLGIKVLSALLSRRGTAAVGCARPCIKQLHTTPVSTEVSKRVGRYSALST
jgi:hypothetical protein